MHLDILAGKGLRRKISTFLWAGYVTVYPAGTNRPGTSNLNLVPGQIRPNLVLAKVGSDGRVLLYNNAGQTHLAVVMWVEIWPGALSSI